MTAQKRRTDFGGKDRPLHFRQGSVWETLLFLVVLLLAVAVMGTAAVLGSNAINNEKNAVFADKWQYSVDGGAFTEVSLPDSEDLSAGSCITLNNYLPSKMVKGATILLGMRKGRRTIKTYRKSRGLSRFSEQNQ